MQNNTIFSPSFGGTPQLKEDSREKVSLTWNSVILKSLQDLREHFDPEELLKAHISGTLYNWLEQHYYETEAQEVNNIKMEDPECLKKLCRILSIPYEQALSPDELSELEQKREKIRQITSDEEILKNAAIVAMDQEELAALLDQKQECIYLCNNLFSVPISKSGIKYIGVGNTRIENAYTKEQYQKAGIEISGIILPDETTKDKAAKALQAAINNGYDDYAQNHSPLAAVLHEKLKTRKLLSIYRLPFNSSLLSKYYNSRSECKKARDNCVKKAYHAAETYFDIGSSKCVAREAAEFYAGHIESVLLPIIDNLETLGSMLGKPGVIKKIRELSSHAEKELRSRFEKELYDSSDYYQLYDLNYFLEKAEIEKHDFVVSEDGFSRLLEKIFDTEYHISFDLITSIRELENDLNRKTDTFFGAAHSEYRRYAADMESLIDEIGKGLPDFQEKESVSEYLSRMCIQKAL